MNKNAILLFTFAATVVFEIAPVRGQSTSIPKPKAQPAATEAKPVVLGKSENVKWTPTTFESATAEAHKQVLASGKPGAVTGEVVDVSCYLQLGKRGEAHIPCGTKCIANGQPIGLVDAEDRLYLLIAEEHHPRRDGQVELKTVFAPLLAKTVTVNGMVVEMKGYRALFVQAVELGGVVKPAEGGGK